MPLLQIAEPNQSFEPHQHRYGIGIDLGTTRSMVAVVRSGQADVIGGRSQSDSTNDSQRLLPSVVYYGEQASTPVVGQSALDYLAQDPANTISSVKRFVGRSVSDIRFTHPYQLQGNDDFMPSFVTAQGNITPIEVSAEILSTLKDRAQQALPIDSIAGAVITVPAYFDEGQRQATKDAAQLAGLNVLRLLNEPTAAALAYGLDNSVASQEQVQLVYDLGGGTFDVSVLKLSAGVYEVVSTGGHSALGGDDIDRLLAHWIMQQSSTDTAAISTQTKQQLNYLARDYKEQLSLQTQIDIDINLAHFAWQGSLTRDQLANIVRPITDSTLKLCRRTLRDAQIDITDVDKVVLVGGSTRMPIIQQAVADLFGQEPLCNLNPDEVVALGAAKLAEQLVNKSSNSQLLLDVTPLSLGLETMGELVEVIIPRNTPIPVEKHKTFTTYQDGQTGMVIHVVQGERDKVADCRSLGRFTLSGIPPMKAGFARIEVKFSIDADGQLTVSAMETTTQTSSHIDIRPTYGLSADDTKRLLQDGFAHAQEDMQARRYEELKLEAQREVIALRSALQEFQHRLSIDEKNALVDALNQLIDEISTQESTNSPDYVALQEKVNQLKPHSDSFAAVIMDESISDSLSGTSVQQWQP